MGSPKVKAFLAHNDLIFVAYDKLFDPLPNYLTGLDPMVSHATELNY